MTEMLEVGTRVKITGDYKPYKTARNHMGVIIWKGIVNEMPLYQVQTDVPFYKGKNSCFAVESEIEPSLPQNKGVNMNLKGQKVEIKLYGNARSEFIVKDEDSLHVFVTTPQEDYEASKEGR
jgi:hypothetical protein